MAEAPKLEMTHKGFGKYAVTGTDQIFPSKKAAERYIEEQEAAADFANEYGDIIPEGIEIHDRTLVYGGSLMRLPMNELYLPNGDHNPYYDRAWVWGWASDDGVDIAAKKAIGYRLVSEEDLKKDVADEKVPEHYLSLLRAEGTRLTYGDAVLMRMPRVMWRQRQAEKEQRAVAFIKKSDDEQRAAQDRLGMRPADLPITNEVSTGLKLSGF